MQKPAFPGRWKRSVTFITDGALRLVNADDGDANWMPASPPELDDLVSEIVNHAINLLDHGLREYLHFHADLNGRDRPSSNLITGVEDRRSRLE